MSSHLVAHCTNILEGGKKQEEEKEEGRELRNDFEKNNFHTNLDCFQSSIVCFKLSLRRNMFKFKLWPFMDMFHNKT